MTTLAHTGSPSRHARAGWFLRGAAALGAMALASPLMAATQTEAEQAAADRAHSSGSPEQVYRQYRADCLAGRTHQDRATCLREAGAALQEARRGRLDNGSDPGTLQRNALQRCQRQPAEDRADCERLARGEGKVSGSVEGGGVIKEIVTRTVGPTPTTR
jgi:hypothetical protein